MWILYTVYKVSFPRHFMKIVPIWVELFLFFQPLYVAI